MFIGIPCLQLTGDAYTDFNGYSVGSGGKQTHSISYYPPLEITLNSSMQLVIDHLRIDIETSIRLLKELLGLPIKQPSDYYQNRTGFCQTSDGKTVLYTKGHTYTLTPTAKRILIKMLEVATGFCKEEVEREFEEKEILQEIAFRESRKDKKVTNYWIARVKDTKQKLFETLSLNYNDCENKMNALNPELVAFDLIEYVKVELYE